MQFGLTGLRVVELAGQIAGPYCGKLLADAGADVVKVEPASGDPLRGWSPTGADLGGADSPLFAFLNAGKRSVVGVFGEPRIDALVASADVVIHASGLATDAPESPAARPDLDRIRAAHPSLVVLSITPYGSRGPWAGRAATEFTLQAESGSIGMRGTFGAEPFQAGGRLAEWAAGAYGAFAALAAAYRAQATGAGEQVDLSILETANLIYTQYSESMNRLMNGGPEDPAIAFLAPSVELPSIEPTADGWVGFCTNSRQQFMDFLVLLERPDLQDDEQLAHVAGRMMRSAEWNAIVREWTMRHRTDEILERASLLRIPAAPVGNGESLPRHEHLVARRVYVSSADGRFVQPRPPYRIDDVDPSPPRPVPRLGADTESAAFDARRMPRVAPQAATLPLAGLRILDLTAWWAGPSATHLLAALGAEVIHVESTGRPDGVRMVGGIVAGTYPSWWEACPHFLHANADKLGITLDLDVEAGRALLARLVPLCDAVVENFTPRVLSHFGLDWERVRALNPRAILLRMPAFGLSGPWRDRPGFAQTMEQFAGLAWVTGLAQDQPRNPRGPCDPLAGVHAAFAMLVALAERAASGRGHHVECTMLESALNVAAEQVVEWSAHRRLLEREGNRSPQAAPQGLYRCFGSESGDEFSVERWVAISVPDAAAWSALCAIVGEPGWAEAPTLARRAGRRAAHDAIDARLREWTRRREPDAVVEALRARGIPAAAVANPCRLLEGNPQFRARRYFEAPEHPVVGRMPLPSLPFRWASVEKWIRRAAPTLGRDNDRVLGGLLGLGAEALRDLETAGVIGTHPKGL